MRFTDLFYKKIIVTIVFVLFFITSNVFAAEIFLDPASNYLTGPLGEEFQLELKVDGSTTDLRLFQVFIKFESSLLDTVSSELGPLFENSGFSSFYNMTLVYDTTISDSVLKVEGLLLGATSVVNGPGTVAVLNFKTTGIGTANLSILSHSLTDINNDPIPSTSSGAVVFINTPPDSFNLISPAVDEIVNKFPGEFIELVWESSSSVYPGENMLYELEYSSDNTFPVSNKVTVSALTDTTFNLLVDDLENGYIFWRVSASGDINAYTQFATPDPSYFDFIFNTQEPDAFNLLIPSDGHIENLFGDDNFLFDWEDALPGASGDIIEYTFYIGETSTFPSIPLMEVQTGTTSQVLVNSIDLPYCQQIYWTVEAKNQHGLSRWASSVHSSQFFKRADLDCSGGITPVDISDLVFLVAFMFQGGPTPIILESGNLDCSTGIGIIDISDLVFLVAFMFQGGPPPDCDY